MVTKNKNCWLFHIFPLLIRTKNSKARLCKHSTGLTDNVFVYFLAGSVLSGCSLPWWQVIQVTGALTAVSLAL